LITGGGTGGGGPSISDEALLHVWRYLAAEHASCTERGEEAATLSGSLLTRSSEAYAPRLPHRFASSRCAVPPHSAFTASTECRFASVSRHPWRNRDCRSCD
jgi:hypothetical protein